MQCKYVRETISQAFAFHPDTTSLFTLVNFKNRLRIRQQNLYTGLIINQFAIPLKEGNLQVDNYSLAYNQKKDMIILTLLNYMMIFSVEKRKLLMVAEAQGKHPYFVQRMVTRGDFVYFTATEQRNIYSVSLSDCARQGSITHYNKFKISAEVEALDIAISDRVLVAICNDKVLRVWNLQGGHPLKGAAIQGIGMPRCIQFSKEQKYLLIGTSDGAVQAWDGQSLGVKNTNIMTQKITNIPIQSVCWFHYSGEVQSHRFLVFSEDGNVKLYSFWFDKKNNSYIGKANQLSLLYINKTQIQPSFQIQSHSFANFIFFSPGVLLFMVDSFPLIYYPVIVKQQSLSYQQLTPNKKKELYYQRDLIFMQNLDIKRIKDTIQDKLSLSNDLEYSELKIIKLEMRPLVSHRAPLKSKFMLLYYLSKNLRILTISNLNLNQSNDNHGKYKEYSGSWVMFIGPLQYYEPLIFILQEDKQTITILAEQNKQKLDYQKLSDEERRYYDMGEGEIYTKKINIKVQRVYLTPFRDHYVVLYQSENLLRFSNNVNFDTELMNYQVFTGLSLRLDYTEIILDVIWTKRGQMGAVVCLDKIVFINSDLKIMRSVYITGYIVQGQWIGYTLLITTKKDLQYLDILGKPQQAYCLQNMQSKYLVMKVMADRIFGIQKIDKQISIRARYFNIMQLLVSGYLNYHKVIDAPIDQEVIKRIIEAYAPYFIVNQQFIQLLNERKLVNFSKYFIEGNQKMYSRPLRAKVLNDSYKIQRFIPKNNWLKNKRHLLDLFLTFQQSKDSLDPYEKDKGESAGGQLNSLIGSIAYDSIKNISGTQKKGLSIANNFGQKSLIQLFYDLNLQGDQLRMEIEPFKAENSGQWLGQFGTYVQAHIYLAEDASEGEKQIIANVVDQQVEQEQSDNDNQLKDLIIYYRIDDGKGTVIDDLSDFGNQGSIDTDQTWSQLEDEPMQIEDKWGKKCPPQFSLITNITNVRKLKTKKIVGFSIELWMKPKKENFFVLFMEKLVSISFSAFVPIIMVKDDQCKLDKDNGEVSLPKIGKWTHFCCSISSESIKVYFNGMEKFVGKIDVKKFNKPVSLILGDQDGSLEYTEFRFWKKCLDPDDILDNMRTPLQIVFEKRKAFKLRIKEKKKKESANIGLNQFAFDL